MQAVTDIAIPICTWVALLSVGSSVSAGDFRALLRQPGVLLTGLVVPPVVLPLIAVVLVAALEPPIELERGLLLVAACPIGGISSAYSALARASVALSIALTAASSVLAIVTIPAIAAVLEAVLDRELGFVPPLALLLGQLVLMLGTPVAVGMFVRRRWPALADVWRTPLQLAAMGGIVGVLIFILTERLDDFARLAPQAVPLALLFTAGSAVTGWGTGAVTAVPVRDRFTLSAEFSTRNVAVAMAIAVSMLGQLEFVVFGSIYFVVEIVLLVSAAAVFRARMR